MSTAQERQEVYNTARWRALRAQVLLAAGYLCQRCATEGRRNAAQLVHHRQPIRQGGEAFDPDNLEALCNRCHENEHAANFNADRAAWDKWVADMVQRNIHLSKG